MTDTVSRAAQEETAARLETLAIALANEEVTSRALVEKCLSRIENPDGEGSRAFLKLFARQARAQAELADQMRLSGMLPSRFLGIPISVKDLFDLEGDITTAGSRVLQSAAPAGADALAIARLRRAGFILIGRTNMTEFAFSGLGLNPHYGTPLAPWDRDNGRIPGGSSSGAAVSVADGMAHAAIGTDTGGSCRIPAAFCGIVGYKPTVGTIPADGIVPLSHTLDSAGPLAAGVSCCATLHALMATGEAPAPPGGGAGDVAGLRIGVPQTVVLVDMDETVARDFDAALVALSDAGAYVVETPMEPFGRIAEINSKGGFAAAEAYAWHQEMMARDETAYDPRVSSRIARGASQSAADYIALLAARRRLITDFEAEASGFDLLAFPTVPTIPPLLAPLEADDALYANINLLMLRNSTTLNMVDGCAVSLPVHVPGAAPVGLTLAAARGDDSRLLRWALAVERVMENHRRAG